MVVTPTVTVTFSQQEYSILLGAIGNTLNVVAQQLNDPAITPENANSVKIMITDLELLRSKLMDAPWNNTLSASS